MSEGKRMKKSVFTGMFLAVLFIMTLVIAGCGGFSGNDRGKCTEGESCSFYSGNRGVMMMIDRPVTNFYYRSSDLGLIDGNTMEFDVRLANDGASDSYGAVFITGFSGDMFQISRVDSSGERKVIIGKDRSSCYFDTKNMGTQLGKWFLTASCLGSSVSTYGGTTKLNLGRETIEMVTKAFGWNIPISDINLVWDDEDGLLALGVGSEYGVMNFGRSLMVIVSSLNFDNVGGSVFTMKGDNAEFPGGDIDYKTFKVQMISRWPAGQDYYNIPYEIKSCYAYTTFVSPNLCIDPNPFSDERKLCRSETYTWGGSQGAPVAVTRVQQTNTGRELILDITIKNVGAGRVWDVGYLEACSPYFPGDVKPNMLNIVHIGYAYVGSKPLDCTNFYTVRLDPNTQEARMTCRYDMTDADDIGSGYTIPLKMELWYGYEESIVRQLRVRKVN
jgi:hypothetical protein